MVCCKMLPICGKNGAPNDPGHTSVQLRLFVGRVGCRPGLRRQLPLCQWRPPHARWQGPSPSGGGRNGRQLPFRDRSRNQQLLRLEMGDLGETHKPPHKVTIRWMKRDVAVAGSSQRNQREDNTLLSQSAPRVDEETYQCIHRSVSLLHSF